MNHKYKFQINLDGLSDPFNYQIIISKEPILEIDATDDLIPLHCFCCNQTINLTIQVAQNASQEPSNVIEEPQVLEIQECPVQAAEENQNLCHCGKSFQLRRNLLRHLKTHNKVIQKSSCPTCHALFKSREIMRRHIRAVHLRTALVTCNLCGKIYSSQRAFEVHRDRLHNEARTRSHRCLKCPAAFFTRNDLRFHSTVHNKDRNFVCAVCERGFKRKAVLKMHLLVHFPQKSHSCSYCEKSFSRRTTMLTHERSHTGERRYVCDVPDCGSKFLDYGTLRRHKLSHTRNKYGLKGVKLTEVAKIHRLEQEGAQIIIKRQE